MISPCLLKISMLQGWLPGRRMRCPAIFESQSFQRRPSRASEVLGMPSRKSGPAPASEKVALKQELRNSANNHVDILYM